MQNYISVTGVTSNDEIVELQRFFSDLVTQYGNKKIQHTLRLGIASAECNSSSKRYNSPQQVRKLLEIAADSGTFHFNPLHKEDIFPQLQSAIVRYRPRCIQINAQETTRPFSLDDIKREFSDIAWGISASSQRMLQQNAYAADFVVIDQSGGKGISLNIDLSARIRDRLYRENPQLIVCYAGGLDEISVKNVVPELLNRNKHCFSLDAESKLRDSQDNLSVVRAKRYLFESLNLIYN